MSFVLEYVSDAGVVTGWGGVNRTGARPPPRPWGDLQIRFRALAVRGEHSRGSGPDLRFFRLPIRTSGTESRGKKLLGGTKK